MLYNWLKKSNAENSSDRDRGNGESSSSSGSSTSVSTPTPISKSSREEELPRNVTFDTNVKVHSTASTSAVLGSSKSDSSNFELSSGR